MHDPAPPPGIGVTGLSALPGPTLLERALDLMETGPLDAHTIAESILGLTNPPGAVASRLAAALLGPDPRVGQLPDGRWALVAAGVGSPLVDDCAFAVVDVETTGGRLAGGGRDRIMEIAVVVVQGQRTQLVFESLINPGRPIPRAATALTGITDGMVHSAPCFDDVADDVLGALAGRVFVAHNVRFDWSFLRMELRRSRAVALAGPRLCTVRLARRVLRPRGSCGLDSLAARFRLTNAARHRAAGDAVVTAAVLQRLLPLAKAKGLTTLAHLERVIAPKATRRRRAKASRHPKVT